MEKMNCVTVEGRKYGLWELRDDNTAVRKCKCCGIEFSYPINKNILMQLKKQYEALPLLEQFLKVSPNNPNLIGYLNVILEDVVDFVEDNDKFKPKTLLDNKLVELRTSDSLSDENKSFIEKFRSAIKSDDNDLFFDTKEEFQEYNADSLSIFLSETKGFSK